MRGWLEKLPDPSNIYLNFARVGGFHKQGTSGRDYSALCFALIFMQNSGSDINEQLSFAYRKKKSNVSWRYSKRMAPGT